MDPTVLFVLALIAADPVDDGGPEFGRPTVAAHVAFDDSSAADRNAAGRLDEDFQYPASAEHASADVATPLGSVDTVLRGQSPVVIGQPVMTQGPVIQSGPVMTQPIDPAFQNGPLVGQPMQAGVSPILPPVMTWKHYAVYENVFVAPYFSQNTSTVTTDNGGAGTTRTVNQFDWDLEYSSRVEFGIVDNQGAGWRARYWHFDHSEKDGGTAGAGTTVSISPNAIISGSGITALPGETARVTHSLRMSVIDLEYLKKGLTAEPDFDISFGLRYARMDQWLNGRVNGAGGISERNSQKHDFEGIGPTIATEYSRPIWFSSWSVFGNARASLLYGDTNYRYTAVDRFANVDRSRNASDTDLLSVFEMQLGVEHRCPIWCCHELFVRAALEGQYWANAGSASADLNGFGTDNAQDTDMGFFGFVISTGLNW